MGKAVGRWGEAVQCVLGERGGSKGKVLSFLEPLFPTYSLPWGGSVPWTVRGTATSLAPAAPVALGGGERVPAEGDPGAPSGEGVGLPMVREACGQDSACCLLSASGCESCPG